MEFLWNDNDKIVISNKLHAKCSEQISDMFMHRVNLGYICHTPSKEKKEPPFLAQGREDHNQHEIEHYSLTHHPAEGT